MLCRLANVTFSRCQLTCKGIKLAQTVKMLLQCLPLKFSHTQDGHFRSMINIFCLYASCKQIFDIQYISMQSLWRVILTVCHAVTSSAHPSKFKSAKLRRLPNSLYGKLFARSHYFVVVIEIWVWTKCKTALVLVQSFNFKTWR